VWRDRISEHQPKDSPPQQHSPLMDHYQSSIHLSICNEQVKIVPPTSNVEVVGMKLCNLSNVLHILKELEYTLSIIPHLKEYYFIYHM